MQAASVVLPAQVSRQFLAADFDAEDLAQVEAAYARLLATDLDDEAATSQLLSAWNEVYAYVAEAGAQLRLEAARYTDRDDVRERFLAFNRDIVTRVSEWEDQLGRKLLESPALAQLESGLFAPFIREVRNDAELFRSENVPIFRELAEMDQRYGEISGAWTVEFEGQERTLSELSGFMESPDRDRRRRAWEARMARCFEDAEALDELWEAMFQRRSQVARNAGFDNFRDYIFQARLRDYGPDQCYAYAELVEAEVVPVVRAIDERLQKELGVERFRPWDGDAEPPGRQALAPFETVDQLSEGVERMMRRLDGDLGQLFHLMRDHMDLGARPNKRQGGFMMTMPASRRPFIFANATGRQSDLVTLLHEAGHAFHTVLRTEQHPMEAGSIPMEFAEVASMAMELLHFETLDEFYDPEQRGQAIAQHIRRIPRVLASVAVGDGFQQWLYTHPEHTREQRHQCWREQRQRFFGHIDVEGLDPGWLKTSWHQILHFFVVPFYFIEYGFAYLGAMQVAQNFEREPAAALTAYKRALSLGNQRDTAGLYAAAGAQFVPTRDRLRSLMDWVRDKLDL